MITCVRCTLVLIFTCSIFVYGQVAFESESLSIPLLVRFCVFVFFLLSLKAGNDELETRRKDKFEHNAEVSISRVCFSLYFSYFFFTIDQELEAISSSNLYISYFLSVSFQTRILIRINCSAKYLNTFYIFFYISFSIVHSFVVYFFLFFFWFFFSAKEFLVEKLCVCWMQQCVHEIRYDGETNSIAQDTNTCIVCRNKMYIEAEASAYGVDLILDFLSMLENNAGGKFMEHSMTLTTRVELKLIILRPIFEFDYIFHFTDFTVFRIPCSQQQQQR